MSPERISNYNYGRRTCTSLGIGSLFLSFSNKINTMIDFVMNYHQIHQVYVYSIAP